MLFLITGASAGFGAAMSELLIQQGHTVIATGRRIDALKKWQDQFGEHFIPLCFDICSLDETKNALNSLPPALKNIDVLVNNAGLAVGLEPAYSADLNDWDTMINTNILGLCHITRLLLPNMVARNKGLIINIGSIAGNYAYPGANVYGATKAFVKQFSLNLRADLAGTNVRVSNVEPGLCGETEFSVVRFKGDKTKAAAPYQDVDYLRPIDIANAVAWIAEQPEHVNINSIEIMPTAQTFAPLKVTKNRI